MLMTKTIVTQEETDYVLCWRKKPVAQFPLKITETKRERENSKRWDPSHLPSPSLHSRVWGLLLSDHPGWLHYSLNPWGKSTQRREMGVQNQL
jgi:hypothetical protein